MNVNYELIDASLAVVVRSAGDYCVSHFRRTLPDFSGIDSSAGFLGRVRWLAHDIYEWLYVRPVPAQPCALARRDFVRQISASNHGAGGWDAGWTIANAGADEFEVRKNELSVWVSRDAILHEGNALIPGTCCAIRIGKELMQLIPGFYVANGDRHGFLCRNPAPKRLRVYWNLTPAGAIQFIRAITTTLTELAIPYSTKVLNDPESYRRSDSAILYLRRQDFMAVRQAIRKIWMMLQEEIIESVPLWTKKLGRGVAVAEDPTEASTSFGQSRSFLAALASWRSFYLGHGYNERIREIVNVYQSAGLDARMPYLGRHSADIYEPFE
jgi:hypothetical protein